MPENPYPCLQCGHPTWSIEKYIVCDDCLSAIDADDERHAETTEGRRLGPVAGSLTPPLSSDERRARLRHLINDW